MISKLKENVMFLPGFLLFVGCVYLILAGLMLVCENAPSVVKSDDEV